MDASSRYSSANLHDRRVSSKVFIPMGPNLLQRLHFARGTYSESFGTQNHPLFILFNFEIFPEHFLLSHEIVNPWWNVIPFDGLGSNLVGDNRFTRCVSPANLSMYRAKLFILFDFDFFFQCYRTKWFTIFLPFSQFLIHCSLLRVETYWATTI